MGLLYSPWNLWQTLTTKDTTKNISVSVQLSCCWVRISHTHNLKQQRFSLAHVSGDSVHGCQNPQQKQHDRKGWWRKAAQPMAAKEQSERRSWVQEYIFQFTPRQERSLPTIPTSPKHFQLWTHQWLNPLMSIVPLWSNHLPKARPLKTWDSAGTF